MEKIGEGGCGVVYLAEQFEPVRRQVALKVIKLGMDTKEVIARFEVERQALALMDHPNIAKVLDAGTTETGRPYFVMELVRGMPITKYCDQNNLPTGERLKLFMQVCHAIQHAHQKGIIHRDIKPSNILVSLHDDQPVPTVIDFGIAKAITQPLTNKTLFTRFDQFIGTPAYMSPEQAGLSTLDIDTRSDIYALGVLLYELLTSRTPFDNRELLQAGLEEMLRRIREEEPPRPSTRLSTMLHADLSTTAQKRQIEPPSLISLLRGDLDWISMKCLEKNRARRYDTANALALDIERHLKHQPVAAAAPSTFYRFQKFARRNRAALATATAFTLLLLAGTTVSIWLAVRATRAERAQSQLREKAQQATENESRLRRKAEMEAAKSEQVSRFLADMLEGVGPSVALGRDTTILRDILDKTAARIATQELKDQPDVEILLRNKIGISYRDIGDLVRAEAMFREALALVRKHHGTEHQNVAASLTAIAGVLRLKGKLQDSVNMAREALVICRKCSKVGDTQTAVTLNVLADALRLQGNLAEAEPLMRESLAIFRKVLPSDHSLTVVALHSFAALQMNRLNPSEAEAIYRDILAIDKRRHGQESVDVFGDLNGLGLALRRVGMLAEAESSYREAVSIGRKLLGNEHPALAIALCNLGDVLRDQGQLSESEKLLREAFAIRNTPSGGDRSAKEAVLGSLVRTLLKQGKSQEAETYIRTGLSTSSLGNTNDPLNSIDLLRFLSITLSSQGQVEEAVSVMNEALTTATNASAGDSETVLKLCQLLTVLNCRIGRYQEAEALWLTFINQGLGDLVDSTGFESILTIPYLIPLVPDSEKQPAIWHYTTTRPPTNWFGAEFPIDGWMSGPGAFGGQQHLARTVVTNSAIWMRRTFDLPSRPAGQIAFRILVGGGTADVFLNGRQVFKRRVPVAGDEAYYQVLPAHDVSDKLRSILKPGRNVLAAYCSNNSGGACFDAGIYLLPDPQIGKKEIVLRLTRALQAKPDSTNFLKHRAVLYAKLRQWQDAANDLQRVIDLDPSNHRYWYRLSPLLVKVGDMDKYRVHCRDMIARFGTSDDVPIVERMVKACLLVPVSNDQLMAVSQISDRKLNLADGDAQLYNCQFTRGLLDYRSGNYAKSIKSMEGVIGKPWLVGLTGITPNREVWAHCVLAMAFYQLKETEKARIALEKATETMKTQLGLLDHVNPLYWHEWLAADILLQEATELINKK